MENGEAKEKPRVRMHKPNNVIAVPVKNDQEFFRNWCAFLRPFVNMTDREADVVAEFLRERHELSKVISDEAMLDKVLMSEATKKEIIDRCCISKKHFYVVMSALKKHGIIENGIINPRLIPNVSKDDKGVFQLMILFKRV